MKLMLDINDKKKKAKPRKKGTPVDIYQWEEIKSNINKLSQYAIVRKYKITNKDYEAIKYSNNFWHFLSLKDKQKQGKSIVPLWRRIFRI